MDADAATRFIPEHRRTNFKNKGHFKPDELRRRRDMAQVELRKTKRDEALSKRRNLAIIDDAEDSDEDDDLNDATFIRQLHEELPKMVEEIQSDSLDTQIHATVKFRKILSRERNPPIDQVIQSGVIPILVQFLKSPPDLLQLEAAWALTNIASGTSAQTTVVVEAGAVPIFIELLSSPSNEVKEQAIWALGNVAGDSAKYRDYVLEQNALPSIINLMNASNASLLRNATWTLSNLCRGKNPPPAWELVSTAIPILAKLIYSVDEEILIDACWALSYLSDGPNEKIQAIIEAGIPRRLVELLGHTSTQVQTPALRTVGNIVTGDTVQTQAIVNCNALTPLRALLSSPKDNLKKEACWTISNITAGTPQQIQAVIDAGIIPDLIRLLSSADYRTKKEACWAISNGTSGGLLEPDQIRYLVKENCIKPLCDLLSAQSADNKIIQVSLDALENILKIGEQDKEANSSHINQYALLIEEANGMDKIFECQNNENQEIYQKSYNIIAKYFSDDEAEAEETNLAPQQQGQTFAFGYDGNQQQQSFNF